MKKPALFNGLKIAFFVGIASLLVGCGGGKNSPSAPAPSTPIPAPGTPAPGTPTVQGTQCPILAGGVPLNQNGSPFSGSLQSTSSGSGVWGNPNSLTLALSFINYSGPGTWIQSVVGSGSFVFPDLALILGNQTNTNYNICVNSNNVGAAGSNPGTYNMSNGTISMSLTGTIQVPLYNPFSGYPGSYQPYPTTQMSQDSIRLNIGTSCATYVSNNRLFGCVDVKIGNSPSGRILNYYSR